MEKVDAHFDKMTKTPVSKLILTLGIPTTISMLITNFYNLVDTYFVGELGPSQQGSIGILFTLQGIIQAIAFMLGHGSGTFVAKSLAKKDIDEASKYVSTAYFLGAGLGFLLLIFGLIFIKPFMMLLGSTETILPHAIDYGFWILLSAPFLICSLILNNNLRYEGKAFFAMIGLTIGAAINILGDYFLIKVFNLGVFGAGLSTAISQFISFIFLYILYRKFAQSKIRIKYLATKFSCYKQILIVGFPSLIRQSLNSLSNGILNNITKIYGDNAIAAMSVINRFSNFVVCVGIGIAQGLQPVAAFNYQVKEYTRVKKGFLFTIAFGMTFISILSLFGIIWPGTVVKIFQKDEAVISIGKLGIRAASIGILFLPISVTMNMLFQSIQRPILASILAVLRSGLIFIPILIILEKIFNLNGILVSQPVADFVTCLLCLPFLFWFLFKTPNTVENLQKEWVRNDNN